jgi:predicted nucleotidyltransferase
MVRTRTEIKRLVAEYVKALEPTIHVNRVILYGSYARGRPDEWSDIDLAIISQDFARKNQLARQSILGRALQGNDAMIETLGYSLGEFNHALRQTFLGEIKRTGKVVYTQHKHRTLAPRRKNARA